MKKIIWVIMLIVIGFLGGVTMGGVSGSVGGGIVGLCLYNAVALKTKVVSPQESKQIARELVKRVIKRKGKKLQWMMNRASMKDSDGNCKEFLAEIKREFDKRGEGSP